jgi:hypothetical protein
MEDNKSGLLDEARLADGEEMRADSRNGEETAADLGAQQNTDAPATAPASETEGDTLAREEGVARRRFGLLGSVDESSSEEPRGGRSGLGYAITGGILLLISSVMLAVLISSFASATALIASVPSDRGFVGISVIVAVMVTIISAVGCIMASLATLYISSIALTRSKGVFRYIAVAEMSVSILFILASLVLSVVAIAMA